MGYWKRKLIFIIFPGGGGNDEALTALAQESYDILTLLPTYIENTKDKVSELAQETKVWNFFSTYFWKYYIVITKL